MNTKRSSNSNRIKSFGLAACAVMALGVMTAGEAAAQCRIVGNAGYGYNTGYRGLGNSYNYGSNFNNRFNSGYGNNALQQYNAPQRFNGYSRGPSSLSLGLSYNRNLNSRYDSGFNNYGTGAYGNRSGFGNSSNGFYTNNSREPVAYRHGDHVDVEDGNQRMHLRGRGF